MHNTLRNERPTTDRPYARVAPSADQIPYNLQIRHLLVVMRPSDGGGRNRSSVTGLYDVPATGHAMHPDNGIVIDMQSLN